jgi:hypothetical protein
MFLLSRSINSTNKFTLPDSHAIFSLLCGASSVCFQLGENYDQFNCPHHYTGFVQVVDITGPLLHAFIND